MKFETYNIIKLAEAAKNAAEALEKLTNVAFAIEPHLPNGSWHPILVPVPRGPSEEEKAGPYDTETKSRRIFKMVTEVTIDISHAELWLCTDRNRTEPITFRIEGDQIWAHVPGIWYGRDSDYQIGAINRRFYESYGVVMDGAICSRNEWSEIEGVVEWDNIEVS